MANRFVDIKSIKMTRREKALLNIIIIEILDCQGDWERIKAITDSWITANDLHPEDVMSLNNEEMIEFFAQ